MNVQINHTKTLEQEITAALHRSAQMARKEAIKHGTGIVVQLDGKMVKIDAEELKKQSQQ